MDEMIKAGTRIESGAKDIGDCKGCQHLISILSAKKNFQFTDEQILKVKAKSYCGYCSRKPEEVRQINPVDRITKQLEFDQETGNTKLLPCDLPLEDYYSALNQSELRCYKQDAKTYRNRDIPPNALRRLNKFISEIVYKSD